MTGLPPEVLGHIVDDLPYPVWYARPDGRREYFNSTWEELTGRPRTNDRGWRWFEHMHPGDREVWQLIWQEASRKSRPYRARYRMASAQGDWQWLTERARPINGGGNWFGACDPDDPSEAREAEIRRLRRIYEAISETNQAIVKLRDRRTLLHRLCEIAVELGGFDTAWIAWHDSDGRLSPVASAGGLSEDLVQLTAVSENEGRDDRDPLARLFATDRRVICRVADDLESDSPWRTMARHAGIEAIGAFPLREYGRLVACFVLHSRDAASFDDDTLALLDEMAGDISFSLDIFMADRERIEAERELRRTNDRLQAIVSAAPLPIVALDGERRVQLWNPAAEQVFAWRRDQVIGRPLPLASVNGDGLGDSLERLLAGRPVRDVEDRVCARDGSVVPVRIAGAPTGNGRSGATGLMALIEDITGEREAALRERFAQTVFEHSPDGIAVTDTDFRVQRANPAFQHLADRSLDELEGAVFPPLANDRGERPVAGRIRDALATETHWQGEASCPRADGEELPIWLSMSLLPANGHHDGGYVALTADISELKAAEARVAHLALHDSLTGLPNRTLLEERLGDAIARALEEEHRGALLFLDLDRFKLINDSLGHTTGDRLLCAVVERLAKELPDAATFSRLGGDEFIIMLTDLDGGEAAEPVVRHLIRLFHDPFEIDGQRLNIRATIGVATFPDAGRSLDTLLRKADAAMYAAKQQGRNRYQWFTEEMNRRAIERYQLEDALRDARDRQQMWLAFQPQVSLSDGRVSAFEALLRWEHPHYGPIDPTRFVPLAEESGEIVPLGAWALRNACLIGRRMQDAGLAQVPIAVNVSAMQLRHPEIVDTVGEALEASGLAPRCLELELTETMLLGRDPELAATLERFRSLGIRLAIDDFGTGYSSMNYLKQFPIDKIKIDRTFVAGADRDAENAAIVRAIIGMATSLGITVVAEGVETREEADFLAAEGCNAVQGFLYAPPMGEADLAGRIAEGSAPADDGEPPAE